MTGRRASALTRGAFSAEHGLKARISLGLAGLHGSDRMRSGCQGDRCGDRAASSFGCAGLHLDQEPTRSSSGPRARTTTPRGRRRARRRARPALRPAGGAIIRSTVYATHRIAPRATACAADDPKDCDARADDERAARWLDEWRYVWSCDGPDECGVRTAGQSERARTAWGSKSGRARASDVPKLSSPFAGPSAATREIGNPTSTGSCALFPSTTSTSRSATMSATSSAISNATSATGGFDRDHRRRPLARRRAGSARSLFRSAHPPRLRLRSLDGDGILFGRSPEPGSQRQGLGIERVYEFGEVLAYGRLIMLHYHPLVPLQSARRQRPLPGLSRRSDRAAQPDRSRQRAAPGRERLPTGEVADGARAVRRSDRRSSHR